MSVLGQRFSRARRAAIAEGRRKAAAEGRPGGPVPGRVLSPWERRRVEQSCMLTAEQVREARRLAHRMRRLAAPPRGWLAKLAGRWGVPDAVLSSAVTGRTWKHLTRPAPVPSIDPRQRRHR